MDQAITDKSESWEVKLKTPIGDEYYMCFKLSDEEKENMGSTWPELMSKRFAHCIESLIRNETSEQFVARIEKEYEEKVNGV